MGRRGKNKRTESPKTPMKIGILGYLRIRHKLAAMLVFIGLAFISMHFVLFRLLLDSYNAKLYELATQNLNAAAVNIDYEMNKLEELSFEVFSDATVQRQLRAIRDLDSGSDAYHNAVAVASEQINKLISGHTSLLSVDYFDGRGHGFIVGRSNSSIPAGMSADILERAGAEQGRCVWLPNGPHTAVCARMVRSIPNYSFEELGVLVFSLDMRRVVRNFSYMTRVSPPQLAVLTREGTLYETRPLPDYLTYFYEFPAAGYFIDRPEGEDLFITRSNSRYFDWRYVSMTPMSDIYNDIYRAELMILAVLAAMLFAVLLVGARVSMSITRPLEKLQGRMGALQKGDFRHDAGLDSYRGRNEIVLLTKEFEVMVDRIDDLIYQVYRKQLAVKDSQYKMLQMQINPHFLYNTLDSINWQAKKSGQRGISRMVEALASLFRESIHMDEGTIAIGEELRLLENYLVIQKIRLEEQLECHVDAAGDALGCVIPKFTLQPLVENSIQHGFNQRTGRVEIRIAIRREAGRVECRIEDDGPGIPPDILEKLRSGELPDSQTSIGLRNIDERLSIAFHGDYLFAVESPEGSSSRILLRFPAVSAE